MLWGGYWNSNPGPLDPQLSIYCLSTRDTLAVGDIVSNSGGLGEKAIIPAEVPGNYLNRLPLPMQFCITLLPTVMLEHPNDHDQ